MPGTARRLIDTHQHVFARDRFGYGWTAGRAAFATAPFSLADYRALSGGRVEGTLFMEVAVDEPGYRDEARHFAALAADPANGILGVIASCRPETDEGFEAWLDECAALGVQGLRRVLHVVPDDVSQSATFRANLRRLGARGFTFDLCVRARQLEIACDLAAACPGVRFVLDHCGVPDIAGGAFAPWRDGIAAIARQANVAVKLSGISAYCAPGTASLATLRPWVDHVLDCFGPARMCWGSDWPVVDLGAGLAGWLAITDAILAGLSDDEAEAIARGTARRIYLGGG